jgi:hypothetical protein
MSEDFRPRKNDHLLEPMFEALGGPVAEEEPGSSGVGALRIFLSILLLMGVLVSLLYFYG